MIGGFAFVIYLGPLAMVALVSAVHQHSLIIKWSVVFLLGIFRRAPPGGTLVPFYFPGGALPLNNFFG
jgi:hypothetical protein